MISRDDFTSGLSQRLRNVLQKHDRETRVHQSGGYGGLAEANTNLDAVLLELGEFVFDALEAREAPV